MAAGAVAAAAIVVVVARGRGGTRRLCAAARADSRRPLQRPGSAVARRGRRFKLELGNDFLDSPVGRAELQRGAIRRKELKRSS